VAGSSTERRARGLASPPGCGGSPGRGWPSWPRSIVLGLALVHFAGRDEAKVSQQEALAIARPRSTSARADIRFASSDEESRRTVSGPSRTTSRRSRQIQADDRSSIVDASSGGSPRSGDTA
jgi:hypothetical protein